MQKNYFFPSPKLLRIAFLDYPPNLLAWVTVAFWTSPLLSSLSPMQALGLGFCSSVCDFAIASSPPHLTMWNLQVALGFVGNYAPCGFSLQIDGIYYNLIICHIFPL
jgi:hypothetical protein